MKHQCVPPLLMKPEKYASVAKPLDITDRDDQDLYISTQKVIIFIIQAAEVSLKNDRKPTPFCARSSFRQTKSLLNELYIRDLEQNKARFLTFVQFLLKKIQQTKVVSHSIRSVLTSTMLPFHYDTMDKSKP